MSAALVKELRERTGLGLMECKKALSEAGGDIDAAIEALRKSSGMKAAMNGVLNFSTLDGWWPEACNHGINGWQFGDGFESEDEAVLDEHDLKGLYKVLQEEVIPTYYEDREKWLEMMNASIQDCREEFAVKRMLEEYYEKLYM